jgi:transposase-like protein
MTDVISHKRFQDEQAAYDWVEAHLWPHGPECPRCHGRERATKLQGKSTRIGTYKCKNCRKPFTVKIGTIFEDSHIPMRMWLQAIALLCASKKGISSNQLHRMLGVTLKSAWFMSHRIREAMRSGDLAPMGGGGGVVEIDETLQGRKQGAAKRNDRKNRVNSGGMAGALSNIVLSLVERDGSVRSFHVDSTSIADLLPTIRANISHEAHVMTDAAGWYKHMNRGGAFASHDRIDHSKGEYGRYEPGKPHITTNTIEGYFSLFKRGMRGTYQHCAERHLHRYLAEFDFRYNARIKLGVDDEQRAIKALKGAKGKRLTYRTTDSVQSTRAAS